VNVLFTLARQEFGVAAAPPTDFLSRGLLAHRPIKAAACWLACAALAVIGQPALAEKPPPSIIEPGQYAYEFALPSGWDFSYEEAREAGVPVVLFPVGGGFHHSKAIIYVNEVKCGPAEAIACIVDSFRQNSPNLQVTEAESIPARSSSPAPVLIFTGASDPRQAREAIAFLNERDRTFIIVLTVTETEGWNAAYRAFRAVVRSYQYFDCREGGHDADPCALHALPDSYQAAKAVADQHAARPDAKANEQERLVPYFGANYAEILRACFEMVENPDPSPLNFVLAIHGTGRVLRAYWDRESNIQTCLSESLSAETFPPPLFTPYFLHIELSFRD